MAKTKVLICPYCGATQPASDRCGSCGGLFEPLSRQATHNAMGPWFVRDLGRPFRPGCSYETLIKMIDRGQVTKLSIIRGPTNGQLWAPAKHIRGVAHLLGYCHNCDASVDPDDHRCDACGVPFGAFLDRNFLGLPELRPLPWEARLEEDLLPVPGGGISRFAHDEELLELPPTTSHDLRVAFPAVSATDHIQASAEGAGGGSDQGSSGTLRALQRKVARQRRTIRFLAIFLGLAATVAAISVILGPGGSFLAALTPGGERSTEGARSALARVGAMPDASAPESDGMAGVAGVVEVGGVVGVTPDEAVAQPSETAATVPDTSGPPAPPGSPAVGSTSQQYAEALQHLAEAGRRDRPIQERIEDCHKALAILRSFDVAGDTGRPDALRALIDRAVKQLERLELDRDFFGEEP